MFGSVEEHGSGHVNLRKTPRFLDIDPDYCVYWGKVVHGRLKNGFLELLDGGFIPEMLGGTRILEEAPAYGGIDKVPASERAVRSGSASDRRTPQPGPERDASRRPGGASSSVRQALRSPVRREPARCYLEPTGRQKLEGPDRRPFESTEKANL